VTFDIDANGILNVTASDKATDRSQKITITASSGLNEQEIERMKKEAEAHADEDKKRKELIEARNNADNTAYTAEKLLRENGDKIDDNTKKDITDKVAKLREMLNSEDTAALRKQAEELGQAIQAVGASMYQQQQQQAGGQQDSGAGQSGPSDGGGQGGSSDEDIVDGEFKNV